MSESESEGTSMPTPGPWGIERKLGVGGHVNVVMANEEELCSVYYEQRPPERRAEMEANARLMSAAPDLLVALVELMESEGGEPRKHDIESARTWRLCESALMKASQKHESAQIARAVEARARNRQMAREARKAAKGR